MKTITTEELQERLQDSILELITFNCIIQVNKKDLNCRECIFLVHGKCTGNIHSYDFNAIATHKFTKDFINIHNLRQFKIK